MAWYKRDDFLNPKKPAEFAEPEPGNIGGIEPDPKKMAGPPGPAVIEVEGTDETDVEREEKAKDGDTVSPVATDDEMYEPGDGTNYRASAEECLEKVFDEPADRGPGVVGEDDDEEGY